MYCNPKVTISIIHNNCHEQSKVKLTCFRISVCAKAIAVLCCFSAFYPDASPVWWIRFPMNTQQLSDQMLHTQWPFFLIIAYQQMNPCVCSYSFSTSAQVLGFIVFTLTFKVIVQCLCFPDSLFRLSKAALFLSPCIVQIWVTDCFCKYTLRPFETGWFQGSRIRFIVIYA